MSLYLGFAKHGVFQFITRIQLLEQELIKQNLKDKKLEKRNIGRSKKGWILEIADDAEEEAEYQCNRMDFLEKKAKQIRWTFFHGKSLRNSFLKNKSQFSF